MRVSSSRTLLSSRRTSFFVLVIWLPRPLLRAWLPAPNATSSAMIAMAVVPQPAFPVDAIVRGLVDVFGERAEVGRGIGLDDAVFVIGHFEDLRHNVFAQLA